MRCLEKGSSSSCRWQAQYLVTEEVLSLEEISHKMHFRKIARAPNAVFLNTKISLHSAATTSHKGLMLCSVAWSYILARFFVSENGPVRMSSLEKHFLEDVSL